MPESVKTRSSSGPTSGAIERGRPSSALSEAAMAGRILRRRRSRAADGAERGRSVGGADEALDAGLLDRPAQAFAQVDLRLPAEQVAGLGDVGLALLRVVGRERLMDDLRARLGDV